MNMGSYWVPMLLRDLPTGMKQVPVERKRLSGRKQRKSFRMS